MTDTTERPQTPRDVTNFLVATRRPAEFLREACHYWAGDDATLQGVGSLDMLRLDRVHVVARTSEEVTVRLRGSEVETVYRDMIACGGVKTRIQHWMVRRGDTLVCAAFDWFCDGDVWILAERPFLDALIDAGVVRWFGVNPLAPQR